MKAGKGFRLFRGVILTIFLFITMGCGGGGGTATNRSFTLGLNLELTSGNTGAQLKTRVEEDGPGLGLCPTIFDIRVLHEGKTILEENTALALDCDLFDAGLIPGKSYTLYTEKRIGIFSKDKPRVTVEVVGVLPGDILLFDFAFSSISGTHSFEVDFKNSNQVNLPMNLGNDTELDTTFFNLICENTTLLKNFLFGGEENPGILESFCGPPPEFFQYCDTPAQECDPFALPGSEENSCPFLDTCYFDCKCHAALCVNFIFGFLSFSEPFEEQLVKDIFGCPDCDNGVLEPELGETCEPVLENCPQGKRCQEAIGTFECTCGPICDSDLTCSNAEGQVLLIPEEFGISCTLGVDCCEALTGGELTCEDTEGRGCCVSTGGPTCDSGLSCESAAMIVQSDPSSFPNGCNVNNDCCQTLTEEFLSCESPFGEGCCIE